MDGKYGKSTRKSGDDGAMTLITQKQAIHDLLKQREGEWVPLPEIMSANGGWIAQYNARIFELRRDLWLSRLYPEYEIDCRIEIVNGERHSWYRLQKVKLQKELEL
jgi:hypothetical protein